MREAFVRDACKGIAFNIVMVCAVMSLATGIRPTEGWYEGIISVLLVIVVVSQQKQGLCFQNLNVEDGGVKGKDQPSRPGRRQPVPVSNLEEDENILSTEDSTTAGENVPVKMLLHAARHSTVCHSKNIVLCLLMTLTDVIASVAASPAMGGVPTQIPPKQNECWTTTVGIVVAIAGVALAIVSTSWWRKRAPDLALGQQQHQALPPQGQAVLDITQAFLHSEDFLENIPINARSFEDFLLQAITDL